MIHPKNIGLGKKENKLNIAPLSPSEMGLSFGSTHLQEEF
jgi:hypothetical protein